MFDEYILTSMPFATHVRYFQKANWLIEPILGLLGEEKIKRPTFIIITALLIEIQVNGAFLL